MKTINHSILSKFILAAVVVGLVVISLVAFTKNHTALGHLQPTEASAQSNQPANSPQLLAKPNQIVGALPGYNNPTSITTPAQPNTVEVLAPKPAVIQADFESINPQNTWSPEVGTVFGYVQDQTSGNACGLGPTGVCYLPVARKVQFYKNGVLVRSTQSDVDGNIALKLEPGIYTIVPGAGVGINPSADSQTITVRNGDGKNITITYWAIATTNALRP